ncbi:bifunctional biotin--[acetyl-CoA-carboxylase] ligase/biotin operon repressor BirA [Streptococcus iniae]|nr:bifunctional biotin--[acetyl-CoA-carboxylase] ligase/biotin operon repressor BirA [Streptococcus iniae]AHY15481.1 GntR family transcriptional regulator [Streptococcus iniae]AHY17349.1 GntR family transcriptional regulator [Streptococcus iniae]AJG25653.1 GntR family transcriptional regulator [Streptococcus iniae]APD31523.1 biotin--[acetyl-CoA-carboxylase] ligase [Streptococcus iniae]ELY5748132.1 bifunctional biotin--[acetyl-CoA-carboxylase] synthetase/biotin operon repressor [Streptococcus i
MKTSERIYELLSQTSDYTSGESLAKTLNLSRTAIWKAVKSLENQGLEIESSKNKGYRILTGDLLLPQQLSQKLKLPVSYKEETQSTQLDAKHGIEANLSCPHLYLANHQSHGKGRLSRSFYSPSGSGIYMSMHLRPNLPYSQMEPYTMILASCVVKAISRLTGIETDIKWVNDIYFENHKIAGILTEAVTSVETGLITDLIIGVGINFNNTNFPNELKNKAGSLFKSHPTITRNQLIEEIWTLFFTIPSHEHIKIYKEKSLVLNKQVTYYKNEKLVEGKAIAITDQGYLIVEHPDGQVETLPSGEVSLSSW